MLQYVGRAARRGLTTHGQAWNRAMTIFLGFEASNWWKMDMFHDAIDDIDV